MLTLYKFHDVGMGRLRDSLAVDLDDDIVLSDAGSLRRATGSDSLDEHGLVIA